MSSKIMGNVLPFDGMMPKLAPDVFIAPGAQVIGNVEIGPGSSIWYNCVIRGDVEKITIGARTNLQDGTIVHVNGGTNPCNIGDDVLVGHMCMIHGCDLHERAFVGMGAMVLDACVMESDSMLAAGAMLTPGKRIPGGELWAGRPAKLMRHLDADALAANKRSVAHYAQLAQLHRRGLGQGE